MSGPLVALGLALAVTAAPAAVAAQPQEVLAQIRIQGNVATPDAEMLRLAGVSIGAPFEPSTPDEVAARLRATKRFERVEVLKRFASIADPTQIALVIIVDEGAVSIELTGDPDQPTRVVRRRRSPLMWLPMVSAEDGYGVAYGVRVAVAEPFAKGSRLSFPVTWGGDKRVGVQIDHDFPGGPLTRLNAGAAVSRRTNPYYEQDDDRGRVWVRLDRDFTRMLRASGTVGWQHVAFLDASDGFPHVSAQVAYDTRLDPILARNAVFARASLTRYALPDRDALDTLELEGRGYVGLVGRSVLVLRAVRDDADGPRPPYLQPLLGGMSNLRGFGAGSAVGDTLVAGSAELRVQVASPLRFGKLGVNGFVDLGTVYDKGSSLRDQEMKKGVGAGVWFSAAFLHVSLAVAHGIGGSTHLHFGGTFAF